VVAPEPVEFDAEFGPGLDVDLDPELDPDLDLGAGVVEAGLGATGVTTGWPGDGAPAEAEAFGTEELVAVAWPAASLPDVSEGHGESNDVPHVGTTVNGTPSRCPVRASAPTIRPITATSPRTRTSPPLRTACHLLFRN
jgi:hypothetical protein